MEDPSEWECLGNSQHVAFQLTHVGEAEWNTSATDSNTASDILRDVSKRDIFHRYHVAISSFGGYVALVPKQESLSSKGFVTTHSRLYIFSSGGGLLYSREWYPSWQMVKDGFGWADHGNTLCCVLVDGTVLLFDQDVLLSESSPRMVSCSFQESVVLATVWDQGIAVLSEHMRILCITRLDSFTPTVSSCVRMPIEPTSQPKAMSVIHASDDRPACDALQIAVCMGDSGGIMMYFPYRLRQHVEAVFPMFDQAPIQQIVAHPRFKLLACYAVDGTCSIVSSDFGFLFLRHDCQTDVFDPTTSAVLRHPTRIAWCGTSFAVGLLWNAPSWVAQDPLKSGLLLLGPLDGGGTLKRKLNRGEDIQPGDFVARDVAKLTFSFDSIASMAHEIDGIRVVDSNNVWLVRQVPVCIRSIYSIASYTPAAILVDAVDSLVSKDPDADASLQSIVDSGDIVAAVMDCIHASLHVSSFDEKVRLLRAACHGKRFVPVTPLQLGDGGALASSKLQATVTDLFVKVCAIVKACHSMHAVRFSYITCYELMRLTPVVFMNHAIQRGDFVVCMKLCSLFRIDRRVVLVHWARKKILFTGDDTSDADLLQILQSRIRSIGVSEQLTTKLQASSADESKILKAFFASFPYAGLASCAAAVGRKRLAFELCLLESKLSHQVIQLLSMKEWDRALRLVNEAPGCDQELQAFAAMYCHAMFNTSNMPFQLFSSIFENFESVRDVLKTYLKYVNEDMLSDLYADSTTLTHERAMLLAKKSCMRSVHVRSRTSNVKAAGDQFQAIGNKTLCQLSMDHARLLEMQHEVSDALVGTSLAHTILDCFRRNESALAHKFFVEFKMSPKAYYRLMLNGLASRRAWGELQDMSKRKDVLKHIKLVDFAAACASERNDIECLKFLELCPPDEHKTELLMKYKHWEEAAQSAYHCGDAGTLFAIKAQSTSSMPPAEHQGFSSEMDVLITKIANGESPADGRDGKIRALKVTREMFASGGGAIADLRGTLQHKASTGCSQQ